MTDETATVDCRVRQSIEFLNDFCREADGLLGLAGGGYRPEARQALRRSSA